MLRLNVKADLKPVHRAMIALGAKQVPFATSLALNELAKGVAAEEKMAIDATFKSPTPFTENAFRIEVATKSRPIAVVAVKDIQASYLAPYVLGGDRSLGTKRGMLAPRAIALNQYGNLPKGKLKTLQGKPNIFVGAIKTKSGRIVNGVWQRPIGKKKSKGGLKLLIQFEDSTPVPYRLDFYGRAQRYVQRHATDAFQRGLTRAISTARR